MSSFLAHLSCRAFSTSSGLTQAYKWHKSRMGRLVLFNKRHPRRHRNLLFRDSPGPQPHPDIPRHTYGCRRAGIMHDGRFEPIPEMVPQLIVPPDLDECDLKPYVSYRTKEIVQEELTAKDIFNSIYGKKIVRDYQEGKLDEDGTSLDPSKEELMTPEEARVAARRTGSDIFMGGAPRTKLWNVRWRYKDTDYSI